MRCSGVISTAYRDTHLSVLYPDQRSSLRHSEKWRSQTFNEESGGKLKTK